jgi:hypothetical protein
MVARVFRTQASPVSIVDPKAEHQKLIYLHLPCSERSAGIESRSKHRVFSVSPLGRFVLRDILIKFKPMTFMQWPL